MAIRNAKLGGTDFTDGEVLYDYDLDDTNNTIINFAAKGQAQGPFTTLKATGTWTNEGNLAADRTTVAAGANGTINTTSSTAAFITDKYICGIQDEASGDTTYDPDSFTNPENAFDSDDNTQATITLNGSPQERLLGKTFSSKFVTTARIVSALSYTSGSSGSLKSISVETFDGSTWTNIQSLASASSQASIAKRTDLVDINDTIQGIRVKFAQDGAGNDHICRLYTLEYGGYTNSDLIVDADTLTLKGDDAAIVIYNPSLIPTDTSIKATLNDGTKNISAETTLSGNDATIIPLTATPTAGNTLEIHYTLDTTDNTKTPEWYGYGVYRY